MKALIVYDTMFGNTQQIAEAIADEVAKKHTVTLVKAKLASVNDLESMDLLIVGSPTHGGWYTEPVKNFLNAIPENGLRNKKAFAFDTTSSKEKEGWFVRMIIDFFGNASKRISRELVKKGAATVASEPFFVTGKEGPLQDGEIERAREFAKGIILTGA
jgi:flavodoxin